MLDFAVRLVGRFTGPQEVPEWTIPACIVSLNLAGLRRWRAPGVDLREPGPFLSLGTPGQVTSFTYGSDRENWVLMGDTPAIRAGDPPGTFALRDGDEWIAVPGIIPLAAEEVPPWQEEFLRLHAAFRDPLPARRLRIRLGLAALLRPFLDRALRAADSPAAALKRRIEEDRACAATIAALGARSGYHPDHLRELFVAEYGLSPVAYRNRCRLANAMSLIGSTTLGIGEIGRRIGFPHVSHFSAFFRKQAGITPREAIARYRHPR